jgi:hypothetical protein
MTDRDKLVAVLVDFGIGHDVGRNDVVMVEGNCKVIGYSSFFARFEFDEDGNFEHVGLWE